MKKFALCACAGLCLAIYIVIGFSIQYQYGGKSGALTGIASILYAGFCLFLRETKKDE